MASNDEKKIYSVTWEGRVILDDAKGLLQIPKVRRAIEKVAESVKDDPNVRVVTRRPR